MKTIDLRLITTGTDPSTEDAASRIADAGFSDAICGSSRGLTFVDIAAPAEDPLIAILDAIGRLEHAVSNLIVQRVEPDRVVNLSDIAERVGLTHEAVRLYSIGRRGPGDFPPPIDSGESTRLWRWNEVAHWFTRNKRLGVSIDPIDTDLGDAIVAVNAALSLRSAWGVMNGAHRSAICDLIANAHYVTTPGAPAIASESASSKLGTLTSMFHAPVRFRKGSDSGAETSVGIVGYENTVIADGFRAAGNILAESLKRSDVHPHLLVYPIIFTYRHYLESKSKNILRVLRHFAPFDDEAHVNQSLTRHDLASLWSLIEGGLNASAPDLERSESVSTLVTHLTRFNFKHLDSCGSRIARAEGDHGYIASNVMLDLVAFSTEMDGVAAQLSDLEAWCVQSVVKRLHTWAHAVDDRLARFLRRKKSPSVDRLHFMSGGAQVQWIRSGATRWATCQLLEDKMVHLWLWDKSAGTGSKETFVASVDDGAELQRAAAVISDFIEHGSRA